MIKGFEEYTYDLSEEEKNHARYVYRMLIRTAEPITNAEICEKLDKLGIKTSGPRIRKMINWMHIHGHLPNLIADSRGYHFAQNRQQLADYAESLHGRIHAIRGRYERVIADLKQWEK